MVSGSCSFSASVVDELPLGYEFFVGQITAQLALSSSRLVTANNYRSLGDDVLSG